MRFAMRRLMGVVGVLAVCLLGVIRLGRRVPPPEILNAAKKQVPGIIVNHVEPELFNEEPA